MADAELVERVRRRMVAEAPGELTAVIRDESALLTDETMLAELEAGVAAELSGAGPLESLLALPGVTDVLVNGPTEVWIDRDGGLQRTPMRFADEAAVRRLAQRLAGAAGRRLDDAAPFVDAALPDGTRLHAVLPPVTPSTTISLRVLARRAFGLRQLVLPEVEDLLRAVVDARLAFIVSGGTGTGKTTLLGAMLSAVSARERLVVIEDARELVVEHPHVVRLVARPANIEGSGTVGLRELVRQALRMRPDRLVVGEFRGAEMVELLVALNTGHEGGAATVHANTAADVPGRLISLGALGGLSRQAVISQVSSAVDVVVHLRRGRDGIRHVAEIGVVGGETDDLRVVPVWSAGSGLQCGAARLRSLLSERGVPTCEVLG